MEMMPMGLIVLLILVVAFIASAVKILSEYERGVVFRLGRVLAQPKGPGIVFVIPLVDRLVRISIRTITMDIEPQDVISRDNVTLKVNAVLYFRVIDPIRSIINVENYLYATSQVAQTHLRSILGEHDLDTLLTERETINSKLQAALDSNTDPWGIKVSAVEIKHVDLPVTMQRAMAKQAEAERERRAKVIAADGEHEAAKKLREAADRMSENPVTVQLRYLQTLAGMSAERSSLVVLPIPIDFVKAFQETLAKKE